MTADLPRPGEPGARLPIEGTLNFRELGGYRTTVGQVVRHGQVFRSDHLNDLTDASRAAISALGIRTVVDLRFPAERASKPSRLPEGLRVVQTHPDGMEAADHSGFIERIMRGEVKDYTVADSNDDYRRMVNDGLGLVVDTLSVIADPASGPVLFHCMAGKDRTGLAAAFTLRLLGVDDDTIRRDYLLTNPYRSAIRIEQMRPIVAAAGSTVERVKAMFVANPESLDAAFDEVDRNGGTEQFLFDRGLNRDVPNELRASLLV
jgi:protein-tyrosine phosphatase